MNPELETILRKHFDTFEIYNPQWDGVVILKTLEKNDIAILDLYRWLNRRAIAFGFEGPYVVQWERLEI